jgi:pimeloyl-ACP methyl ester carboxylesterase
MCDLIAGSTLEIIEKAGHLPTLEQADIVNKALLRWLEA